MQKVDTYTPMTYNELMDNIDLIPHTLLETKAYERAVMEFWSEEEQREFKTFLGLNAEKGDIIPDTDGLRKIRWSSSGHGKRGGARVIYYIYDEDEPIYLLFAYSKNVKENLSEKEKKAMRQVVRQIKQYIREGGRDNGGEIFALGRGHNGGA